MITISKKIEYSIVLIAYLAKTEGQTVSLKEVVREIHLPYRFLGQLAVELKEAGIVVSKEGKTGGYSLNKGWEKKSLYNLLEALGENKRLVECLAPGCKCPREGDCKMRKLWYKVENSFVTELKKIKLKDI